MYRHRQILCERPDAESVCIACNRYVKWEALGREHLDRSADFIATGHYARVEQTNVGERYAWRRSATTQDQTYALNLDAGNKQRTLMPV